MTDTFRGFRCWTASRVQESVFGDIASLGLDADAVFLAAHTSLDIRHVKGAHVEAQTPEQGVLRSLTSSFGLPSENTVIAVTGPSGTGKSHLVRWLRAHLSDTDPRYHLIYVPRELATLRDLIGRVLDGMPVSVETTAVRDELEKAISRRSPVQLAEELLDRLRLVISFELSNTSDSSSSGLRAVLLGARAAVDTTSRRENGLADLLLMLPLRDHMLRPDGAIRRIVDSLMGRRAGRDEEVPEFTPDDVILQRRDVQSQIEGGLRNVWRVVQETPDAACALLNEALPRAVADVLGMRAGVNLGEVFRRARTQLREQNKDLVLLFEDLAQFGLFDGELFDQFLQQPGGTLAPIRAVFAITDFKFQENVPDGVRTRLAHRFEIVGIDAASEDSALTVLLARYLNVARIGRQRLVNAWRSADPADRETGRWIPNACWKFEGGGECPHRETCWPSFGYSDAFGLYPYNPTAIRRAVSGSADPVTPRVVVDSFVHDFLLEADAEIPQSIFPSEGARERFDFSVALFKDAIVPPSNLPENERSRLYRARVIWADGSVEASGITEAFALPQVDGTVLAVEERPDGVRGPYLEQRPQPLTPLFNWENGTTPLPNRDAVFYREALYAFATSRVDLNALLIDASAPPALPLLRRVVTPSSFEFTPADPGRPAGPNQLRFQMLPSGQSVRLLSAVRWFWDHGHWDTTHPSRKWDFVDSHVDAAQLEFEEFLDSCAREIEGALVASLLRGPLDPAAAAVALRALALQALGRELPTGPAALDFVLSETRGASSAPSTPWASASAAAVDALARIDRSWVQAFATARQGDTGDPQAIDTARLMPALERVRQDPAALLALEATFDEAFADLQEQWHGLREALRHAALPEVDTLGKLIDQVVERLAGADLGATLPGIQSAGRVAAENTVFRPQHLYESFGTACQYLMTVTADEVHTWTFERQQMSDGADALTAALAAQKWAGRAGAVAKALGVVAECLQKTSDEVDDRVVDEVGEPPEKLEARIRTSLTGLSDVLAKLGDH